MQVFEFLKLRTQFIRQHYNVAAAPFLEIIHKIESGEAPYAPRYSEDDEPAFLSEWIDAQTSLELLGIACVSLLSDSLRLYFTTWERELQIQCKPCFFKKGGFLNGYKACFGSLLNVDWEQCPADFDILEQVALARNRGQHPSAISHMDVKYSRNDLKKHPMPFFASEQEKRWLVGADPDAFLWIAPSVQITRDTLFAAIEQVEKLGGWLEHPLYDVKYPSRRR